MDVSSPTVQQGTGATLAALTTSPSSTFDGLILAFHSCLDATSPTPGTWSGHTGGLAEIAEQGAFDGTKSIGTSVSAAFSLSTNLWSSTATKTAPVGQNSIAALIVYTAVNAKRAAEVEACTGFEFGTIAGLATSSGLGVGIFDTITGSPAIVTTNPRTGTYCLELSSSAAAENCFWSEAGTLSALSNQIPLRLSIIFPTSLPASDVVLFIVEPGGAAAAQTVVCRYINSSQKIGIKVGTGSEIVSDAVVTADNWISIDLRVDGRTSDWTCDWNVVYIDGNDPVDQTQATMSSAVVATTGFSLRLGWTASSTATVRYDDVVVGKQGGHYPLGDMSIQVLTVDPSGTVTVNGSTTNWNTFTLNGTMAAWDATTARDAIKELPPVIGASANGLAQINLSGTDYVEIPMTTISAANVNKSIRGVRMLACGWAATTTAATIGFRAFDGVNEMTLKGAADYAFDASTTAPAWVCNMVRGATRQDWTQAKLDALAFRVGFSSDATPDIGIHAIYAEVALVSATTYRIIEIEGSDFTVDVFQDTDSASVVSYFVTTPPGTRGATFTCTISGVPSSVYVDPNSTYEQVIGAVDIATVTSVGLEPDAT